MELHAPFSRAPVTTHLPCGSHARSGIRNPSLSTRLHTIAETGGTKSLRPPAQLDVRNKVSSYDLNSVVLDELRIRSMSRGLQLIDRGLVKQRGDQLQ